MKRRSIGTHRDVAVAISNADQKIRENLPNVLFEIHPLKELPVILNIPHSSTYIPDDLKDDYLVDDLTYESQTMADLYTDEIFSPLLGSCGAVISQISRICIDMERFDNKEQEGMELFGMGAVYTMSSRNEPLRVVKDRQKLIDRYYKPYHRALEDLVAESLKKFGKCFIIDCHSFNEAGRWYEDLTKHRPEVCIGTDDFHTPNALTKQFIKLFESKGYETKRDTPFSGTIVPLMYYQQNSDVTSIMIELNRKLYMNEQNFMKKEDSIKQIQIDLLSILKEI